MILNFKYYRDRSWGRTFKILIKALFDQTFGALIYRRALRSPEYPMAPRLKKDDKGNSFCVSCELCAELCPTAAIDIKVDTSIQMPQDLAHGPAPMEFVINDERCVRCSLCIDVCPVNALTSGEI